MMALLTPEGTPFSEAPRLPHSVYDDELTNLERPPGVFNDKPSPPFSRVVGLFEVMRDSKAAARKDRLDHWFNIWRSNVGKDLYPAMRLILPHKDRERATYGLKEAGIAKAYIGALGLDKHSRDAVRLIKWRQPTRDNKSAGDFPNVLFEVVNARSTVTEGTMSVDDVNDVLDEISRASKEPEYVKLFSRICERCTPNEQYWIIRIILKDLGIQVKETTVLAVFHPDAMDTFNTSSDLKRVCWLLPNPNERATDTDKQVHLFHVFQPMLCKRSKTLKESVRMMGRQEFIMEEKLDGERMQLHKRGNQFYYCSRKGKDYTYLYGATVGEGALTPFIQDAIDPRVMDVILDGEMVVWDPSLEKYCNFGNLKSAALDVIRSGKEDAPRPCYKIFDILYLRASSGKETLLTEVPLKNRRKTITQLFKELPGRLEFAIARPGKNVQDVEKMLQEIVEARGEGLVLKTPMSKYILGGRESCWMKVKPEYMDNMGDTVDVLVVSGKYGSGSRGGRVSTLICAVKDDSPTAVAGETRYLTFVRIGTGLTFADYEWVNAKKWKPLDRRNPPSWMRMSTASSTDDVGDVYLEPSESFILSVKAASISATDQEDLKLEEVLSYSELVSTALGKRKAEDLKKASKKRKFNTGRQIAQLSDHSRGQTVGGPAETDVFDGLTFRIHPDNLSKPPYDKSSLEKLVHQHGGDFTQAVTARTVDVIHVYGGTAITPPLKAIIRNDEYDIFKPKWILDCVEQGELVHPTRKYCFHAASASKKRDDFEDDNENEDDSRAPSSRLGSTSAASRQPSRVPDASEVKSGDETEDEEEVIDQRSEWTRRPREEEVDDVTRERLRGIADDDKSDAESVGTLKSSWADVADETEDEDWVDVLPGPSQRDKKIEEAISRHMSEMSVNNVEDEKAEKVGANILPLMLGGTLAYGDVQTEMGEGKEMEYDENKIFRHLCFYLDTPNNSRKNGLTVKVQPSVENAMTSDFSTIERQILANGGRVSDSIREPKLTHVVVHEKDKTRRIELMCLTSQDPETHLVLKLLRLQVLTPLAVLVNIATFLICGLVIKPSMRDLSKAFPTAVTPHAVMMAMLWMIIFALQILYCVMLVIGRKHETRETLAYGVGLRLVFANWLMVAWSILFTLKFWLPATIILSFLFVLLLWVNLSLIWYPTSSARPLDFISIHAPMRLFLLIVFLSSLPQSIFISLDWIYSADHPERDYDKRTWEAVGFVLGTNFLGLIWVVVMRDWIWAAGGVWTMVALMSKRPKAAVLFGMTILVAVLYPLSFIVAMAWHRLRQKDREGVIALPPDDPEQRERVAEERVAENNERPSNGDGAAQVWSESDPEPARKRRRSSEPPSEGEGDPDKEPRDEGLDEQEEEESEEESNDTGEEYQAPQKPTARKSRGTTSKATGDAELNGSPPAKKPRVARATKVTTKGPPKGRRKKGKAGDVDVDPKALAKESAISDDNVLFNAILNPNAALQSTAEDFLDSYGRASGPALADLISCVLRACGCNATVDADQVLDSDGVVDCLDDMMEALKKESPTAYPLASKLPVFKKFRKSLAELFYRIIVSAAETGALFDEEFIPTLQTWVIAMSSAQLRSFRHTATVVALEVESALAEVAASIDKEAEVLRRQKEGEKKKAQGSGKGKGREQELQVKFDEVQQRRKQLKEFLKEFFNGLFVLRYRDADPGIRAECVQEFGVWLDRYPAYFLEGGQLRYLGWVLSDMNTQVRLAAVKALNGLYKRGEYLASTNQFTQRFKQRLVAMATSDVEVSVRVSVIQVLCAIDALGELEEEQTEALELLVFDQEPRVRRAVSGFVHGIWKAAVDDKIGRLRSGASQDEDRVRIGFKCLASLLVKWAKKLETDEDGAPVPDQTESQEGNSDSGGGYRSKEVTAMVSDLQRGRIALCVESLWDEVDVISNWQDLVEYLLLDHSAEGDEDGISPVATKRKKAAEASAKNRKGKKKVGTVDGEVDELWRLDDAEEAVLVEVLVAALKKTVDDTSDKKKGEADAIKADMTRVFMKSLPRLFAKHQADERRISEVLIIPQLMSLELYAEMGMNKAYESLWDDVTKQFLSHSSPIVIHNSAVTISRLLANAALFAENNAKITSVEEELASAVRDVVAGRDDLDATFLEDDEVHALGSLALRVESLFRVRDMSTWLEDDENGKQSSAWNIFITLASRASQGRREEEMMLDHIFQVLSFHIAWKVRSLPLADPVDDEEVQKRKTLQEQRDLLVETLDTCAFGTSSQACDAVKRSAFKCLLLLYTLFLPKQGDAEGHPYPASSMPLEMTEQMQYRLDGYVEAEVERYADDFVEANESDDENENADSDSGAEDGGEQTKSAKKVKRKKQTMSEPVMNQVRLEKEYIFTSLIASYLSAVKAGIINIRHTAKPLSYYGRLGATYDQCMKVVIELLREEGMYKSHGFDVADVIGSAVKESYEMYLDGRASEGDHTAALAKALTAALVIRGAQLSIVQRLDGDSVVSIHSTCVTWITKKIAQYENNGNKKLRNAAIEFFHILTQLLVSVESGDAAKLKEHLTKALAAMKIEPSQSAKFWEPLRAYERRLTTAATKDKAPAKGRRPRKSAVKPVDEAPTTDEEGVDEGAGDDDAPARPTPLARSRNTRSHPRGGKAAGAGADVPASPIPKTKPRPKPRMKHAAAPPTAATQDEVVATPEPPTAESEAEAKEPTPEPPVRTNGSAPSPSRSPELGENLTNGHSKETTGSKRKRTSVEPQDEENNAEGINAEVDMSGVDLEIGDPGLELPTSPATTNTRKHHSRPSSQISQISHMDIDFFKTRKRIRR
ncbi:hypothetical protein FRB99_006161 [Tulasnella sp. 403]|nr:hypothetical protein FRB99_006161 [Tulasnella sp. 403]